MGRVTADTALRHHPARALAILALAVGIMVAVARILVQRW
jgi:hypothetical protein